MLPVPTYLTASTAPVSLDTPVMVLPVQVRQLFRKGLTASLHHLHLYLFYFFCFCYQQVCSVGMTRENNA